jgi:hypothetical protein
MASIYEMMMGANKSFQDGRAQGQQQHLGQLYSQALTAPQDQRTPLLAQMAQVSPDAAVGAQRSLADGDETAIKSTMQALSMATAAWKAGNKDMAQGFYTQAAPHLASLAGGKPLPPQMDDAAAQAFEKILASASGNQQQLSPHVIGNALVGPDGQVLYQGEQAAKAPAYKEVPDGQGGTILMQFDPQSGGLVPAQIGGDQQPPPDSGVPVQAGAMLDPTKDYPQLASAFPGTQVSSLLRSPQHNAEVGGVPNSQHMRGTAGDFVIPKPEQAAFIAKAKAMGYEVIPEGDHVHVELPPGRKAASSFAQGARIGYTPPKSAAPRAQVQTLSAAEVQQMGLPAGTVAQRDDSGRISVISRPPTATSKPADDAKAQKIAAARADALDSVTQAIDGIDTLTKSGGFDNLGTYKGDLLGMIPHTATKDAGNALETVKNQVLLTTLGKLKALSATGASGFGALSNQEGNILKNSIANLETAQSHAAIVHNLKIIRGTLQKAAGLIGGNAPQAATSAPAQGGHVDDLLSKYGVK